MNNKEDRNAPLNPTTAKDSSQVLVGSVHHPKEVITDTANIKQKQNTLVNVFSQDLVGSVCQPKLDLNNFSLLNHNYTTVDLDRDKINLSQVILEISQSGGQGKVGSPPVLYSTICPTPPIPMEGLGARLGEEGPSCPPLNSGVIAPIVSTPLIQEEEVLIQQVKELLHNEPFRECDMPKSLNISPDEHLAQQVERFLKSNLDLVEEEIFEKVLCSLGNDLDLIHSSLPFSTTLNPSEVPINSPQDVSNHVVLQEMAQPFHSSPAKTPIRSSIAQVQLNFPNVLVSPGKGRPPKNHKTQLEIDVGIQQVLSSSFKKSSKLTLGKGISGGSLKKKKICVISPPVTRSIAVKRSLHKSFGENSSPILEKRGVSTSPREQ